MRIKTIRQSVNFKASPHDVYEALMDSEKHAQFTGGATDISRETGGRFTAFDGYSKGENIELIQDKKIVQTWRASDWMEGHYSQVTFLLNEAEGGTLLNFIQTGVPEEQYEDIAQGWWDYYWNPMKETLEK
ncbi:MAG: SRPBCC domain-containing protein [Dehalococcoidia bacterium]|nr:MAG: SRPBCC domain-containing protein [Dehalococcoidia bacterium]